MDKALFRAYVKELVKESVAEEVKRLLPKLLDEAVQEVKTLQESSTVVTKQKQSMDRAKLAAMMGLERHGDTMIATTKNMPLPENIPSNVNLNDPSVKPTVDAITKNYSDLMKKMGLSK